MPDSESDMPYRVEIAERALRDLEAIFQYIHAEHSAAAAAWFNGLEKEILSLANSPRRGTRTQESPSFRQVLYGSKPNLYRIIYSANTAGKVVSVVHVRHGARRSFRRLR